MTSTHAVAAVKRALSAKKAGHAGTLDPLASGILPIALGEATKTVPFVMDGRKSYVFTVAWGAETDTDDAEGEVVERTDRWPDPADDRGPAAALHRADPAGAAALLGHQDPGRARLRPRPRRRGGRAAGRARSRSTGWLSCIMTATARFSRPIAARAPMCAPSPATSAGRSAASGISRPCGAPGSARSRRADAVVVDDLATDAGILAPRRDGLGRPALDRRQPRHGGPPHARAVDHPARPRVPVGRDVYATCGGVLVAVGDVERGELVPHRVFNLGA